MWMLKWASPQGNDLLITTCECDRSAGPMSPVFPSLTSLGHVSVDTLIPSYPSYSSPHLLKSCIIPAKEYKIKTSLESL